MISHHAKPFVQVEPSDCKNSWQGTLRRVRTGTNPENTRFQLTFITEISCSHGFQSLAHFGWQELFSLAQSLNEGWLGWCGRWQMLGFLFALIF
jgi:hypothetical protein